MALQARPLVLIVLVAFTAGCSGSDPAPPSVDAISIPSDVPEQYVVTQKGGEEPITVNGRECYVVGYQEGWKECYQLHKRGRLDLNDKNLEPVQNQEPPLFYRARTDGFKACLLMLRERKPH